MTKKLTKRKKARGHERGDREKGKNGRTKETLAETRLTSLTFVKRKGKAKAKLCKEAERSLGSQSSGRKKSWLPDKLTQKMQGFDTVGDPYL